MTRYIKLSDGTVLNSPKEIHHGVTRYFQNFFTNNSNIELAYFTHILESVISAEVNLTLCQSPSMEEVKDKIFSIPKYSAQGLDGFGFELYTVCWEVIKRDVLEAVQDFFKGSPLSKFNISSYIVLILKVKDSISFDKFRPICLCSVAYKICSKFLVKRMTRLLPSMIS